MRSIRTQTVRKHRQRCRCALTNTTGSYNTAIGDLRSAKHYGRFNIALGASTGAAYIGSNNIDIGNPGVAGESNTIRIGSDGM